MKRVHSTRGMSILEVVIATSILLILTTALGRAWQSHLALSSSNNTRTYMALLLEETAESLVFLRDKSWTTYVAPLSLNTPYHLSWNGTMYVATSTETLVQSRYRRTFTLSSVQRDGNDNIASAGVLDARTKKATITISATGTTGLIQTTAEILLHDTYSN